MLVALLIVSATAAAPRADALVSCVGGRQPVTFGPVGDEACYTVPAQATRVRVLVAGGSGAVGYQGWVSGFRSGGLGALLSGLITVTPGSNLYATVGGIGSPGQADGTQTTQGGYNGGGSSHSGGGGGGATELRACSKSALCSGDPRLFVAGGGGGSGMNGTMYHVHSSMYGGAGGNAGANGGNGDGCNGASGCGNATGGTGGGAASPTGGGAAGSPGTPLRGWDNATSGGAGSGGFGGEGGGGGGGGVYGGGGGGRPSSAGDADQTAAGGGGGGSSLVAASVTQATQSFDATRSPRIVVTPLLPPDAPTQVKTDPQDGAVDVSFSAPAFDGNDPITSYTVTATPVAGGAAVGPVTGTGSPIRVDGITNGEEYTFTVKATNSSGTSGASDTSTPQRVGVPTAPAIGSGTRSSSSVDVTFSAPARENGSPITSYRATAVDLTDPNAGGQTGTGPSSPVTVGPLTNGHSYKFTVTATNARGESAPSAATAPVTPADLPGAPTGVSADAGNQRAAVVFTAPTSTGGSAIGSYTATAHADGHPDVTATGAGSPLTLTGLINDVDYSFTVYATNSVGPGPASQETVTARPEVCKSYATAHTYTAIGEEQCFKVPEGVTAVHVDAVGERGGGTGGGVGGSASGDLHVVPGQLLYAVVGNVPNSGGQGGSAGGPARNGGKAGRPGGSSSDLRTCSMAAGSCDDAANSTASRKLVAAGGGGQGGDKNTGSPGGGAGGAPGQSGATAPTGGPDEHGFGGEGGGESMAGAGGADGGQPGNGGNGGNGANGGQLIPQDGRAGGGGGGGGWFGGGGGGRFHDGWYSNSYESGGGGGGSNHAAPRVVAPALGNAGAGEAPHVTITPVTIAPDVPDAPTVESGSAQNARVTIHFRPSADDGGSPITSFVVTASPGGATAEVQPDARDATVVGLDNGTPYTFTVKAENAAGDSAASGPSDPFTPIDTKPGAPVGVAATAGDKSATVTFARPGDDGGQPLTSFRVVATPGGKSTVVDADAREATVNGLVNGTSYTFKVYAANPLGESVASTPSNAVVPAVPTPPGGNGSGSPGGDGSGSPGGDQPSGGGGGDQSQTPPTGGSGLPVTTLPQPSGSPPAGPTNGDDVLTGDAKANRLCGLLGNDKIFGLGGNDTLFGDVCNDKKKTGAAAAPDGDDKIDGGAGNDTIYGAGGRDTLTGGAGNDKLYGGDGNDKLDGGAGNDTLDGGAGTNVLKGGAGNDKIVANDKKKETIDCGPGKDTVRADKIDKLRGCEKVKRSK